MGGVASAAGADARRRDAVDAGVYRRGAATLQMPPAPPQPEGRMGIAARCLRYSSSTMRTGIASSSRLDITPQAPCAPPMLILGRAPSPDRRTYMARYLVVAALQLLLVAGFARAQTDPLIGTWKLNLAKSTYDPGPPPQSLIHKYEAVGKDTYKNPREVVSSTGEASQRELTLVFDGTEHHSSNDRSTLDRRIDAYNLEGMSMTGGKITQVFFRFVSRDGKTLTMKTMGIDAQKKWFSNVEVFDKQ
jgi:hypothetical protein